MRALGGDADVLRLAIQQDIAQSHESQYAICYTGCCWSPAATVASRSPNYLEKRRTVQRWAMRFEALELIGLRDVAPSAECGCRPTRYSRD